MSRLTALLARKRRAHRRAVLFGEGGGGAPDPAPLTADRTDITADRTDITAGQEAA